jgi:hypothetical protein
VFAVLALLASSCQSLQQACSATEDPSGACPGNQVCALGICCDPANVCGVDPCCAPEEACVNGISCCASSFQCGFNNGVATACCGMNQKCINNVCTWDGIDSGVVVIKFRDGG